MVAGNNVYVSVAGGTAAALDGTTGHAVWQDEADMDLTTDPDSDGTLTAVADEKDAAIALDEKGAQKWKIAVNGKVLAAPLVERGLVTVRVTDSRVPGLDPSNGECK